MDEIADITGRGGFDLDAARAIGRVRRFYRTPVDERHVVVCRRCGGGVVDHVERDRLRCPDCGAEDAIGSAFAVLRSRWLDDDLVRAVAR